MTNVLVVLLRVVPLVTVIVENGTIRVVVCRKGLNILRIVLLKVGGRGLRSNTRLIIRESSESVVLPWTRLHGLIMIKQ